MNDDPRARRPTVTRRLCFVAALAVGIGSASLPAQTEPAVPPQTTQPANPTTPPAPPPAAQPVPEQPRPVEAQPTPAPTTPTELPEVTAYLKNGQRITGLLIDATRDRITLRVAGIRTNLPMEDVEKYDILPPIMQRYNQLRASVGDDPDQIVHLAEWLQARERYALALTEVMRALAINPDHGPARRMKSVLEQQILLKSKANEPEPQAPASGPDVANPVRPKPGEFPLLTTEQINLIKVYEVDLKDKPRLNIPRDAVVKMLEANAGHPLVPVTREGREAILRKQPNEILDLMFRLQARDYYKFVEVIDQPRTMKLFRDDVQRTWLMSCATTACHGGLEAGRLVLHNKAPNSEASVYTNFLILNRFVTTRGVPLINWDNPDRSPLLQMALPREDSLFPHPAVPKGASGHDAWKPEFHDVEDRRYKRSVEWIEGMYRPRPNYPVEYTPLRPFQPEKSPDQGKPEEPIVR